MTYGPNEWDAQERLAQSTILGFTADDGPLLARFAGEAQANKRGGALRQCARPVHTFGVMARGTFTPCDSAGPHAPPHLRGQRSVEVIARFSGCDAGPDEDDRRSVPRGLAVRFLLGGPHSTDLVSMSTNRFPVTTREAFLSVSAALSSRQPLRLLRVGYLCIVRQFWGPWTFLTTFAPKSYTRCDYYAIHTFMWSRGGTQPVRYRWRTPVPHRRPKPWTRLFKSRDYLSKDLADRLRGGGVRFSLEVQNGKEVAANRLRNLGRPLPRSVKWKPVGELHLDRIVTGDEESALSRIVFSPAHLCEGIEPYPGDEIFVARAAAYPASQVFRTGGSP